MNTRPLHIPSRARRGTVMILVIWIVLVLTVVAYSLSYEMRIAMKMTAQGTKRIKAQALARMGLARAVVDLRNDRLIGMANPARGNDTLEDVWAVTKDKIDVKEGGGFYSVVTVDEERKLNVNTVMPQNVDSLVYLFQEVGGLKDDAASLAANAVIDFKDQDLMPMGGKGDDEIAFYTDQAQRQMRKSLGSDWAFRPKNDLFLTMGELMNIPGITGEVLYGDSTKDEVDPLERAAEKKRQDSNALADYITVHGAGAVNINTAPVKVLEALLFGATRNRQNIKWGKEIEKVRQSLMRKKKGDSFGISNMGQLPAEGIPGDIVHALEGLQVGVGPSTMFTITSRGEYDGVRVTVKALVMVQPESYTIDPSVRIDRKRDPKAQGTISQQPDMVVDPAVRVINMSEF